MQPPRKRITGTVMRSRIAPGSKSDHVGVVLRTESGKEYILRRSGGNAFRDEALEELVGNTITGVGFVVGQTFIMKDWTAKGPD
jgi:hypothetical protein